VNPNTIGSDQNPARSFLPTTMNITLNPDQSAFVQNQIEEGQYININALISDAIKLLADRHQRLVELRAKVAIGTEQIRNGQLTDGELVFDRLQRKLS